MQTVTLKHTNTLEIRGYSDDTFGVYGPGVDLDDDDCATGTTREAVIKLPDGSGYIFRGVFPVGAGWMIGISPLSEDKPGPLVSVGQVKHTMAFKVLVPPGTVVTLARMPKQVRS